MKVCRVCLTMDVKMYHISEHNLSVMYEHISGLQINIEDELPKMLCWECVARLSSAHKFKKKALRTHSMLVDKIKSSRSISVGDIESIDKTQLKSTLGVQVYRDNYSYTHIERENDNCYEESEAEFSELNYVNIKNVEEQLFVIQDVVSAEKDPIKREYSDDNDEQISEYENNIEADVINESIDIKFPNTEFKTEILETSVTENASDEEMVIDNESEAFEMLEEKMYIKVETTEVYDPIKQNRKRKKSEPFPHCKEPRVVLESNKHNTQDNCQSASVGRVFSDAVSSNNLLVCDKSIRIDNQTNTSVFTCDYCTFETSVKSRLTYHTNTKHHKSSLNCAHCDFVTNSKSRLVKHINSKHTKNVVLNCSYCTYNTHFKSSLNRHINIKHTKSNVFKCTFCNYEVYNKFSLTRHVNSKHTKANVFKCSFCNYETYDKRYLKGHVNSQHTKTDVFNCSLCDYKTYDKRLLKEHINAKHTKTEVFNCSLCDYRAYNKRHLKGHMNSNHTKVNVFSCSYCSFKSYQKAHLNAHVNTKHTKIISFNCSFCNYKTYNKINLKGHINTNHTKVNVFICSYCNLQVYYKENLIRHIKAKHS